MTGRCVACSRSVKHGAPDRQPVFDTRHRAAHHRGRARAAEHVEVRTEFTQAPGHATQLAAARRRTVDAIVVFSGDGTYNEALNGAHGTTPFGFLPGGGTSVFPRALGLPRDPVAAAREVGLALAQGRARRISLGAVNGRRFSFSAGLGFDGEAVRRLDALGRDPAAPARRRRVRADDRADAARAARAWAAARDRRGRPRRLRARRQLRSVLLCRPVPLHIAPGPSSRTGSTSSRPSAQAVVRATVGTATRSPAADEIAGVLTRARPRPDRRALRQPKPFQSTARTGDVDEAVFEARA